MSKKPPKLYVGDRPGRTPRPKKSSKGFNLPRLDIAGLGDFFMSLVTMLLRIPVKLLSLLVPPKGRKSTKSAKGAPPPKKAKPASSRRSGVSIRWMLFKTFLTLGVWLFCFGILSVMWFSYDLPDVNQLQSSARKASVTIQARDGTIIGTYGDLYEDMVKVADLPPHVPQALMAIEDRRFYHHFGLDFIGLFRAAYANYKANRVVQGGSTITQQLAKNFLQTQGMYTVHDRSLRRKIQELILAVWLELKFTKEQILTMYLNRVYFGSGTFGIEAAARKYYSKSARDLTVYEAAAIAGLLKAPSRYSPTNNPQRSRERATLVLVQMMDAGYIKSVDDNLKQQDQHTPEDVVDLKGAHFFADWVFELVPSLVGSYEEDLVVTTTFDPQIQKYAEVATRKVMDENAKSMKTTEISLVAMDPDGGVRAMIGGMNYGKSQYNRATQALRQPGSAFKPFVYLAALESGFGPGSTFSDEPVSVGAWAPKNFRKYIPQGEISMATALMKSVNTVTVRIASQIGGPKIASVARRLGITSDMMTDLSICLGSTEVTLLELVGAYATFANKGNSVTAYGISEIRNKQGTILYQREQTEPIEVIKPQQLSQMVQMLTGVVTGGTGRAAKLNCPMAGKTGSNADKDAWFIGFTNNLVAGIWTGNDNNAPMNQNSTGGRIPAKTFAEFMKPIVEANPPAELLSNVVVTSEDTEGNSGTISKIDGSAQVEGDDLINEIVQSAEAEHGSGAVNSKASAGQNNAQTAPANDNSAFDLIIEESSAQD